MFLRKARFHPLFGIGLRSRDSDLEQTTPRCKVCSKSVASKGSSTTNLLQHLRQKHPAEWEKCCAQRNEGDRGTTSTKRTATKIQTTVTQTFANCIPYEKNSPRWKAITDAIAMYRKGYGPNVYGGKARLHKYAKSFGPQVCATKPNFFLRRCPAPTI